MFFKGLELSVIGKVFLKLYFTLASKTRKDMLNLRYYKYCDKMCRIDEQCIIIGGN